MKRFIVVLAVALLTSACGGAAGDPSQEEGIAALDDAAQESADPSDETKRKSTKVSKRHSDKQAAPSSNLGSARAKGGGSSPGGGGGSTSSSAATRRAAPIPAGTYSYSTDGESSVSGSSRDLPETTTLAAEAPKNGEQVQVRDLRDKDGNGTVTETRLLYRSDGVYLTYVKVTSSFPGGFTDVREFKIPEPQLVASTGAGPGFKQAFSIEGSGTRADFTIRALRFDTITIGTTSVETLVVDTNIVFSGQLEGEQNSTSWFWPKYVVMLREQVHTDVTNGPIRVRSDYEAVARQLPR